MLLGGNKSRHLAIVKLPLPQRCELHPSFDADYCPVCGTARVIGQQQQLTEDIFGRLASLDQCEAAGVDGTGRTGGPFYVCDVCECVTEDARMVRGDNGPALVCPSCEAQA